MRKILAICILLFGTIAGFASSEDLTKSKGIDQEVISLLTPTPESTVASDTTIEVKFSIDLDAIQIKEHDIKLKRISPDVKIINGNVAYDSTEKTLSFVPLTTLEEGLYEIEYKSLKALKSNKDMKIKEIKYRFNVIPVILESITLSSDITTLIEGESTSLSIIGHYSDDSEKVLTDVEWNISDTSIVSVDTNGNLSALKAGTVTLKAQVNDIESNEITIEVEPPVVLESLSIIPSPITLRVGQTLQLNIQGHYSDGTSQVLEDNIDYTLGSDDIASVESTGEVTGLQVGSTTFRANVGTIFSPGTDVIIAEEMNTSNFNFTHFGSRYVNQIPADATVEFYDEKRFCMIAGVIYAEDGSPLSGVRVSIHGYSEYGSATTNLEGAYAIPAEGGLPLTMRYSKEGYTTIDRNIQAPIQEWVRTEDVTMLQEDSKVTTIDLSNPGTQVHISSSVTDESGTRSSTLVFDGVTRATVTSPEGTSRELTSFDVRATEFQTPESMPANLPRETAFTYCTDLKIDGTNDNDEITFNAPVVMYVENFLGFDVGEIVPVGYYDRKQGKWIGSENGAVVQLLDTNSDGVVDALDSTGDGQPNDLDGDGSIIDEVAGIAGNPSYVAGNTYWRASFTHFTPWDYNWPYGPPDDADDPDVDDPKTDDDEPNDCHINVSSYVTGKSRVFHEDIPIAGTDISLHYSSKRVEGYKHIIDASVDTSNLPSSVLGAKVTLSVAGKTYTKYPDLSELGNLKFVWDGKDVLDNLVTGEITATISVAYQYALVYYSASSAWSQSWALAGESSLGIKGRDEVEYVTGKQIKLNVEAGNNNNSDIANGWTFSNVHYGGGNNVYKGNGETLKTDLSFTQNKIKRKLVNSDPNYNTVDHWIFEFDGGNLEIDTLTEFTGGSRQIDINEDGLFQPVDLYIYLFKKDENGNWQYVSHNDDSSSTFNDGSVHRYDSYLNLNLSSGTYLLAISNYYLSRGDALSGKNSNLGYRAGGPYEVTFNKTLSFTSIPFGAIATTAGNATFSEDNVKYVFSKFKHIATETIAPKTLKAEFNYDAGGYLTAITDKFDQTTVITRDSEGNPTLITAPNGQNTYLAVDEQGNLTQVRYEDNSAYSFTYFDGALMDVMTDSNGNNIQHIFNANGRITEELDGEEGSYKFLRNVTGDETFYSTVQPMGETRTSQDIKLANGDTQSLITLPTDDTMSVTFSKDKKTTTSQKDGVNSVTVYMIDTLTQQKTLASKETTQPSGLKHTVSYHTSYEGNQTHTYSKTKTITRNNKVATIVNNYNDGTNVLTSPEGRVSTRTYDVNNLLTSSINTGTLTPTSYTYDTKGRTTKESTGTRETTYTYDAKGNVATITDPRGQTTTFNYNIMDRVTTVVHPNGTTEEYEYDSNFNMIKRIVPTPADHTFTYNGVNSRTSYTSPLNKAITYTYDKNRRVTAITKPNGSTINNTYDKGRLVSTTTPEGTTNYSYLFADKVGSISKGSESFTYTYDGALLTGMVQTGVLSHTTGYTYNNDFQVTSNMYAGATENYTYDNDGLLTSSGDYTLLRDAQNAYTTQVSDGTLTQNRTYNAYGEVTQVGDNTFTYELSQRDNSGAITQKKETLNGTTTTYDYTFDEMGRLTEVQKDSATVENYTYDNNGNRASATVNGASATAASYTLDDQLEVYGDNTYRYDEDGYLQEKVTPDGTSTYSYGTLGELKSVITSTKTIEYLHNANNQRVAKKVNGTVVEKYLWADLITLLAIYDSNDNLVQRFEYADGRMPLSMTSNGTKYYLHYDQVGSLRAVSDSSGNIIKEVVYDTFGTILSDSNEAFKVPFGFAGGLYDQDTKLTRFGYRDYDAETGKWTAKDPIGFDGGDSNLYGYVLGDPVNFVDPTGEFVPLAYLGYAAAVGTAYYTYQGALLIYNEFQKAVDRIDNPKELTNPEYNKQICDTADGVKEVAKELGHDLAGAGIPFNKPIREAGGLIYDIAQ